MEQRKPLQQFANDLRLSMTPSEVKMHNALITVFAPYNVTIHPQEPIGPYIADFYLSPCNIVIEVDGSIHNSPKAKIRDRKRNTYMQHRHIKVMRFQNQQVNRNALACAKYILGQSQPLTLKKTTIKITYCPPGSAIKPNRRINIGRFLPT